MTRRTTVASLLAALGLTIVMAPGCGSDGDPGPAGPKGDKGDPAAGAGGGAGGDDASISAVVPARAFLSREVDIAISGSGTAWTDGATVDFGPGINVSSKTVASATGIVVRVSVSSEAALGPRDVTVTEGESTTTFKGAFTVESPLDLGTVYGKQAQGSIVLGSARMRDLSTPFDTTTQGDGFFTPLSFPNVQLGGSNVSGQVDNVSLYSIDFTAFIDVLAPAGAQGFVVASGPAGDQISSPAPGAFTVAARTPIDLTASATGETTEPFESKLFKYTVGEERSFTTIDATSSTAGASPILALLPESGSFADLISVNPSVSFIGDAGKVFYLVELDQSGAASHSFDLAVSSIPAVAETEPNEACAQGQAIPSGSAVAATLSSNGDVDWYSFTVAEADVGKVLHVQTKPGDARTDTVVDVLFADCTTTLGGPSDDSDYHENFYSAPIPTSGTYYIRVSHSTYAYNGEAYALLVTVEDSAPEPQP